MEFVYLLWHSYAVSPDRDEEKLIGVYATKDDALAAQARVADKPGFRDTPAGFEVCEYKIGRDGWTEGYVTVE